MSTGTDAASSKKKTKAERKAEGSERREKKGAGSELPVDVSRLDLRIGKIIRAWKHPDADSLYVEEGEKINELSTYNYVLEGRESTLFCI